VALRYEVWTRQESGTFERKFTLKGQVGATFTRDMFGQGSIELPMTQPRLNDILSINQADRSLDQASIIRVYEGDVVQADFYIDTLELEFSDLGSRTAVASGGGRGTAFDRVRVWNYDWGTYPSKQPDWTWGQDSLVGSNAGVEDTPYTIGNPGAEDGTTLPWIPGIPNEFHPDALEPDSFLAVEGTIDADTGDWYFEVAAEYLKGVYQEFPVVGEVRDEDDVLVKAGEQYTITARIKAPAGKLVDMVCTNAKSATTGTFYNGTAFAQITGNGAYQTATVVFRAAEDGNSELRFISSTPVGVTTFQVDTVTIEGWGIGTAEWNPQGQIDVFQGSAIVAHTGSHSVAWFPSSGIAGNEKLNYAIRTEIGVEISASVWVYHTEAAARNFRFLGSVPGVDPNITYVFNVPKSVPPTTWTEITGTGVALSEETDIEIRWDENFAPVSNLHADDLEVLVGKLPATLGEILRLLIEDASTDHVGNGFRTALDWLTLNFSDTVDSNGAAWDTTLAVSVRRGQTYRQVLDDFGRLGYTFTMTVNPADETEWILNAYNPGTLGTDLSAADGPAILPGRGLISAGPFIRREPRATLGIAEGADNRWEHYRNFDMEVAWGEIEDYLGTEDISAASLIAAATELVESDEGESLILSFQGHRLTPGIDYVEGDEIRISLGENILPSGVYTVAAISVRDTPGDSEPLYQVEFQPLPIGV